MTGNGKFVAGVAAGVGLVVLGFWLYDRKKAAQERQDQLQGRLTAIEGQVRWQRYALGTTGKDVRALQVQQTNVQRRLTGLEVLTATPLPPPDSDAGAGGWRSLN